jgi:Zn-finger nucleic acid-binding protein
MVQCPVCDVPMEDRQIGEQTVCGCPECGGLWGTAHALATVVKEAPGELVRLDRAFNPGHTHSLRLPRDPVCAACGGPLAPHAFPIAPDLPLLSCAACHTLFLADDQPTELVRHVDPEVIREVDAAAAGALPSAADEAEIEDADAEEPPTLRSLFTASWPERPDGCPWLTWFVMGMPLWAALLAQALSGALLALAIGVALGGLGSPVEALKYVANFAGSSVLGWPGEAIGYLVTLKIIWYLVGEDPGMDLREAFCLTLRLVACLNLVSVLLMGLCSAFGHPELASLPVAVLQIYVLKVLSGVDTGDLLAAGMMRGYWF